MLSQLSKNVFSLLITVYRTFFRATFGNACCFQPSCSEYCSQAVQTHGVVKGITLGLFRILRCHPLSKGGVDMVPMKPSRHKTNDQNFQSQNFKRAGNL